MIDKYDNESLTYPYEYCEPWKSDTGDWVKLSDHVKELERYKCCGNCRYCYSNHVATVCEVSTYGRKDVVRANDICDLWELKNE